MASLIETAAEAGLAPLELGGLRLEVLPRLRMTSVAPFAGQAEAASGALRAMGLDFPAPNNALSQGGARIVWTGRGQAFLMGPDPAPLAGLAALSDQSDGWARLRLSGAGADQVLARLVPVDLRPASFAPGAALRAPLGHMMAVLIAGPGEIEVMIFRSMLRSAWHEIETAMRALAARAGI